MGVSKYLTWVFQILSELGIPADRGYPKSKVQMPEETVAAVTVEQTDPRENVLAVHILGPASQGGIVCEDTAQRVAEALREQTANCHVQPCRFDGVSGMFCVKILAHWSQLLLDPVKINNDLVSWATDFSAVQTRQVEKVVDAETGVTSIVNQEVIWTIALQEQLPLREVVTVDSKESFTLSLIHENCKEIFPECYWLSITLEENEKGRIRKRIARSWSERIVVETTA